MKLFSFKKRLHIVLPIFFFLLPIAVFFIWNPSSEVSAAEELSQKLLRFHVIANSDSEEDQAVKLKVKERVLSLLSPTLSYAADKEEAKQLVESRMDDIVAAARDTLRENEFSYSVHASVTQCEFPVKTYGDLTFPAGTYEALRIVLGDGEGKNWWCVMYPPLCFVDASFGTVPEDSKKQLSGLLTEDTYDSLETARQNKEQRIPFRFGIFTFLNNLLGFH